MKTIDIRPGIAVVLLAATLGVAAASPARTGQVFRPVRIHIRLVDLAGLPDDARKQAENIVEFVFRQAGLQLDFVDCPVAGTACNSTPGPSEFWLQILNRAPKHLTRDCTGFTMLVPSPDPGDSYAVVSLPLVKAAARQLSAPLEEVLAASMAHEIGHLVLHSPSHSHAGIMAPKLDRKQIDLLERGSLLFTGEQSAQLTATVRR